MDLPWIQVTSDVIEHAAPDLAVMLGWTRGQAVGGLTLLFNWALKRARNDRPPSQSDTVRGPMAALLVARAADWDGDPSQFISACEHLVKPPLELIEDGSIRIFGLDRYDAAWGKNQPKEVWAAWKAFLESDAPSPLSEPVRNGSGTESERNRAGIAPEPVRKIEIETQIETEKEANARSSAPVSQFPAVLEKPDKADDHWDGDDFWAWAQAKRREAGLQPERPPNPRKLSAFWNQALMQSASPRALRNAFVAFGNDPYWVAKERAPPVPFGGFITQWERFIEPEVSSASG